MLFDERSWMEQSTNIYLVWPQGSLQSMAMWVITWYERNYYLLEQLIEIFTEKFILLCCVYCHNQRPSKQVHLRLRYTLHTASYGWWIKPLPSCSLTTHFIHKPKMLQTQLTGWEDETRKDGARPAANERDVVHSLPLSQAFMLPL